GPGLWFPLRLRRAAPSGRCPGPPPAPLLRELITEGSPARRRLAPPTALLARQPSGVRIPLLAAGLATLALLERRRLRVPDAPVEIFPLLIDLMAAERFLVVGQTQRKLRLL